MKTYNEIVDNLEKLEKELPQTATSILNQSKEYTDDEVADGVQEAKQYADSKFSLGLKRAIVESLPTEDIDTNTIYMVLDSQSQITGNVYNEYMYINSDWELIGTTETASVALYQHNITIYRNLTNAFLYVSLTIINNKSSQFNQTGLLNYLKDNSLTSLQYSLNATGTYDDGTNKYIITGISYSVASGGIRLIGVNKDNTIWENLANIQIPTNASFSDLAVQIS